MPWKDYAEAQIRGIDETDRLMEETWVKTAGLLLLYEAAFRRRLRRRLVVLPITGDGHFDLRTRSPFLRFRVEARQAAKQFADETSAALVGRVPSLAGVPAADLAIPARGAASEGLRDALRAADRSYQRARRLLARDRARARALAAVGPGGDLPPLDDLLPPDDTPPPSSPSSGPDAAPTPEAADVALLPESKARAADAADAVTDLLMNVWGNLGNEARRFTEQMLGLVTSFGTRDRALAHLDGPRPDGPPGSEGWYANRNHLRKSVVEHMRGMHRRRTLTQATADGITHFRLDLPQSRLGRIAPEGAAGKQVWRVRTLPEWEAVQAAENASRNASSDFAGLGFGYGDLTYVTAVPREYLAAAQQQGDAWRRQYLGARTR